jgi:cell filamentation protein
MYDAVNDPYCYTGTTVLVNKLGIRDQAALDDFEAEITAQRATEPLPHGNLGYAHYRTIHRHLFQDVYVWAGKARTVRIAKGGNPFCFPENIANEMTKLFDGLKKANNLRGLNKKQFVRKAAHLLAEINAVHPFREGNGRTQLAFLTLLADKAKHPLALERMNPAAMLEAMIFSFEESDASLERLIESLLDE